MTIQLRLETASDNKFETTLAEGAILVAGGAGFLGSWIVRRLVQERKDVYVAVRPSTDTWRLSDVHGDIKFVDIQQAIDSPIANVDAVVNLLTDYGRSGRDPRDLFVSNLAIPVLLADTYLKHPDKVFINAGTLLPKSVNRYAFAKWCFRQYLEHQVATGRRVELRIEHMYGPFDDRSKFVPWLVNELAEDHDVPLTAGTQERDLIHVSDVADAFVLLLEHRRLLRPWSGFEVGTGQTISVRDAAEFIRTVVIDRIGHAGRLVFGARTLRPNEPQTLRANPQDLLSLGWRIKHELSDSLKDAVCDALTRRGESGQ